MIWGRVAVAGALALALAGCAGRMPPSPTFDSPTVTRPTVTSPAPTVRAAPFDRLHDPRTKKDALPVDTPTGGGDSFGVVRQSSRLLATTKGARYFVARSNGGGICLVIYPRSDEIGAGAACGGPGGLAYGPLRETMRTISAVLVADNDPLALEEPGFVRVAKNLAVKETGG
jgi:hypothetical protein